MKVLTIQDLAREAHAKLPEATNQYYNSGAGDMITLRENEAAFDRFKIRPRVLRDMSNINTSTEIFGSQVTFPLGFAPSAAHALAHSEGEVATSAAAACSGIPMVLSSWSTKSLEDVIAVSNRNPYAMQITNLKNRQVTEDIVRRAETAGYKALFLTVDLPTLGNRKNEERYDFSFPKDLGLPNLLLADANGPLNGGLELDPAASWDTTIPWLRQLTSLQIWLKGIYTPEDVRQAIVANIDGIVISNHGGRQLDGVPASLDVLRECAPVARGKIKIAIDGGIRRGSDIFKAIALGADFCFVGRAVIWGLAYDGEDGVKTAVDILLNDFQKTMILTGCTTIADISKEYLSVVDAQGRLAKL